MKKHIIQHNFKVTREQRCDLNGHNSFLIWLTGLSGSGKSTIANALEEALIQRSTHTYILDGDNVRSGLNSDLTFSEEDRVENIRRIAEVANLFVDSGVVVLAAFISPYRSQREAIKAVVGAENFIEVYVKTSLEECERRDVKGLYKKARAGEIPSFTGISAPYEEPLDADIVIDTQKSTVDEAVAQIIRSIESKLMRP